MDIPDIYDLDNFNKKLDIIYELEIKYDRKSWSIYINKKLIRTVTNIKYFDITKYIEMNTFNIHFNIDDIGGVVPQGILINDNPFNLEHGKYLHIKDCKKIEILLVNYHCTYNMKYLFFDNNMKLNCLGLLKSSWCYSNDMVRIINNNKTCYFIDINKVFILFDDNINILKMKFKRNIKLYDITKEYIIYLKLFKVNNTRYILYIEKIYNIKEEKIYMFCTFKDDKLLYYNFDLTLNEKINVNIDIKEICSDYFISYHS